MTIFIMGWKNKTKWIAVPMSKLWSQPRIAPIFLLMPWSLPSTHVHLSLWNCHFHLWKHERNYSARCCPTVLMGL